ncbi:MAG: diaminopimelate epimerase [Planctomycetota bacterium]
MKFIKMHGCGNDYVLVDGFEQTIENPGAVARALCDRRFGIGADGFIVLEPAHGAQGRMRIFNPDGSEAEMCGNGIRCVARFLFEKTGQGGDKIEIETQAGKRVVTRQMENGLEMFDVNMGKPVFLGKSDGGLVSVSQPEEVLADIGSVTITGVPVSVGNPHFVVFVDDMGVCPVREWGPAIERLPLFENGTNVEFIQVQARGRFRQRTWERGAGETLACGTGASAAAAVAVALGKAGNPVIAELLGGWLSLSIDDEGVVFMRGEAIEVFRGATGNSIG